VEGRENPVRQETGDRKDAKEKHATQKFEGTKRKTRAAEKPNPESKGGIIRKCRNEQGAY
jgi:hypothetical protein